MLERELNECVATQLRKLGLVVLQEVRLHPAEFDIVALDPETLRLANFEIKRRGWLSLLHQAIRGQLYCHFAIAVLPLRMKDRLPVGEFAARGIGLVYYRVSDGEVTMELELPAELSHSQNRGLKRQMYSAFAPTFGEAS